MSEEFDIEELLQTHLSEEHETVPDGLFPKIEATILSKEKRKKRLLIWWLFIGGIGLLGLGIAIGNYTSNCNCYAKHVNIRKSESLISETQPHLLQVIESKKETVNTSDNEVNHISTILDFEEKTTEKLSPTSNNSSNLVYIEPDKEKTQTKQPTNDTQNDFLPETIISEELQHKKDTIRTKIPPVFTEQSQITIAVVNDSIQPKERSTSIREESIENDSLVLLKQAIYLIPHKLAIPNFEPVKKIPSFSQSKMGIIAYGGPSLFNVSLFKPYFESGHISKSTAESFGAEYGIGIYRKISPKFNLHITADYNIKKSGFNYDLMVSESDYFDLYLTGNPIPLENLDDPNSCNCFLVEDVNMKYNISTINLNIGGEYNWINYRKLNLNSQFNIASNLSTTFNSSETSTLSFPDQIKERFSSIRFNFSTGLSYQISNKIAIGVMPSFSLTRTNSALIFSKNIKEFIIPLAFKFSL